MDKKKKQTKGGVIGSTKQGNQWPQNMVTCWSKIRDRKFFNFLKEKEMFNIAPWFLIHKSEFMKPSCIAGSNISLSQKLTLEP